MHLHVIERVKSLVTATGRIAGAAIFLRTTQIAGNRQTHREYVRALLASEAPGEGGEAPPRLCPLLITGNPLARLWPNAPLLAQSTLH